MSRGGSIARVFITGSSDGLGLMTAKKLSRGGHKVVLHARDLSRADAARAALPECEAVVVGDVTTLAEMKSVAAQVNDLGAMDAVVHNVGIGDKDRERFGTEDDLSRIFAVNVMAPYVLTALLKQPERLIYISSNMHLGGNADLSDAQWEKRRWNASQAYSDTKLHDTIMAMAFASRWPNVMVNAVDPGWVPTKMGGAGAPDDLEMGADTQAWLAASEEPLARVTGEYFHHRERQRCSPSAHDPAVQAQLLAYLEKLSGVSLK